MKPTLPPDPPRRGLMQTSEKQFVQEFADGAAVAARDDEDPRLSQLSHYIGVMACVWLLFSIYYVVSRPQSGLGLPCLIASVVTGLHYFATSVSWITKKQVAACFLGFSVMAILVGSLISNHEFALPQYFLPVVCLISAHVLGVKAAVKWFLLVVVVTFFCYAPNSVGGSWGENHQLFDQMLINLAVSFTVVWLSDQSEQFLIQRSAEFNRLTDNLRENARLLELAEETAGVGHWRWNMEDEQFEFSDELKRILHCTQDDVPSLGLLLNRFNDKGARSLYRALIASRTTGESFECDLTLKNNCDEVRYVSARGISERDDQGAVTSLFGVIRDDTALKEATSRLAKKAKDLRKLASFDPLTGLANRFLFRRHLQQVVKHSVAEGSLAALLVLDMDGFKEINDTLGHAAGDLVLKQTAKRIRDVVGQKNVVARLGGDEFTVILRSPQSVEQVIEIGEKIVADILRPMKLHGSELHVGASIGASLCPIDSHLPEELFTFADTAMYSAKFEDKDIVIYESWMTEELVERKRIESRLSGALMREEFHLVYQPQVDFTTNRINGFEALVRWNQNGETISPAEFIPLLESTGKIVEVGNWIFESACQQAAVWYREGFEFTMAVNISPLQFREEDFTRNVIRIIEACDLPPHLIDIEITETMLISDVEQTSRTLDQLRAFGTKISVDDFGTGYSSLAYLKDFPIDRLKIDRAFIKDFPKHDDGMIATSIIVLGQSLDLEVLAEGVETKEQFEFLKKHFCNSFQGHYFSVPVEPEQCLAMLREQGASQFAFPLVAKPTALVKR